MQRAIIVALWIGSTLSTAHAEAPDAAALIKAEHNAMVGLAYMNGVWRGPAWTILPDGSRHEITQTERIGPFLDGSVKVIEGRGYDKEGKVSFNALGIISYSPATKTYSLRSYALGYAGDFPLKLNPDGYEWEIPAGPVTIHYTATVQNGAWKEVGHRIGADKKPVRFFEMNLKRVGDSDWPAANPVPPK